jgi:N-methylhydantoinase B/oxoprolinase/acetone carboxylase alpha subunit
MKPGDVFVLETPGGGGWGVEPAPAATAADGEQGVERLNSGSEPSTSTVVLQSASPQAGAHH